VRFFPTWSSRTLINFLPAAAKGSFITQAGLAGFALWEMGGDYNNILFNAITSAIAGSP
jgi:GH18 family chitinase